MTRDERGPGSESEKNKTKKTGKKNKNNDRGGNGAYNARRHNTCVGGTGHIVRARVTVVTTLLSPRMSYGPRMPTYVGLHAPKCYTSYTGCDKSHYKIARCKLQLHAVVSIRARVRANGGYLCVIICSTYYSVSEARDSLAPLSLHFLHKNNTGIII